MTQIKQHLTYWKLAYMRAIISMLIVGGIGWQISTATITGAAWSAMSGFERFGIILGVMILMGKDLLSFLDKTISRMDASAPVQPEPIPEVVQPSEPPKP